jgi:ParB family chromosome partitioning protein
MLSIKSYKELVMERLEELPISEIFCDEEFNVRDAISTSDVRDLAKDIKENGLFQPIIVRPFHGDGYKYKIVAGHRRYKACRLNKMTTIKAIIREDLDDNAATVINFSENVQRRDLNLAEEAKGIAAMLALGMTENGIAKRVGKSRPWVDIRVMLLNLPIEIQREAAAGFLKQEDIKELYKIQNNRARFQAVKELKDARSRADNTIKSSLTKKEKENKEIQRKKVPKTSEVFEIQDIVMKGLGPCLATRALAYCAGEISVAEFMQDVEREAISLGKAWRVPVRYRPKYKV